jgi:hypothetical protein
MCQLRISAADDFYRRNGMDEDKPKPRARKTETNITATKRDGRKVVAKPKVRKQGQTGVKKNGG